MNDNPFPSMCRDPEQLSIALDDLVCDADRALATVRFISEIAYRQEPEPHSRVTILTDALADQLDRMRASLAKLAEGGT